MGQPSMPVFLPEGLPGACTLHGHDLKWANCTPLSTAMGIDRSTLGKIRLSGCQVRDETNDYIGGTTMGQCAAVAEAHGVHVELHTGANVASPFYTAVQAQAGRGFVLQGNASVLVPTIHRSTAGPVNHAIWVNTVRGGRMGVPERALVYDPAANGRLAAWGRVETGPAWWPWNLVLAFAAALRPWGDDDRRTLGPNKFYTGIFPDTEPHVHLKYGAKRGSPFPDKVAAYNPLKTRLVRARERPDYTAPIVDRLRVGTQWDTFQVKLDGSLVPGDPTKSRIWYGNHDGNFWVHESGVRGRGGT